MQSLFARPGARFTGSTLITVCDDIADTVLLAGELSNTVPAAVLSMGAN